MPNSIRFNRAVPILRIFSVEKAKDFYCGFLGFKVEWEHTFEPGMPVYMQVSRGNLRFHLSEHHGDGSPGANVFVEMTGLDAFYKSITRKPYKFYRPSIEEAFYGARVVNVLDPSGNRISFNDFSKPKRARRRS